MKNKITDVRNLLIEAMERLLNPEPNDSFDIEQAKALADLGKVVIESAKAEVMYMKTAEGMGFVVPPSGFFNTPSLPSGVKDYDHAS